MSFSTITRAGLILLGAISICLIYGCPGKDNGPKPNPVPNILHEDFGTGVTLLQEQASAESSGGFSTLEKWVVTMDELVLMNPYEDRPAGKDLLVAIISKELTQDQPSAAGIFKVTEMRIYPAPEGSQITFFGKPLVELSPGAVEELLGKPLSKTQGSDSNTHLVFIISSGESHSLTLRLVTSHLANGRCFAASIAIEQDL